LTAWPPAIQHAAADSLGKALRIAGTLGPQAGNIAEVGKIAFVAAMHSSAAVLAIVVSLVAAAVACRLHGRDDESAEP
jgi:hypothetical protein